MHIDVSVVFTRDHGIACLQISVIAGKYEALTVQVNSKAVFMLT